jgi:uncharacterized protein (DUF983 family)
MLMLNYKAMVGAIILSIMISGLVIRRCKPQIPVWSIMAFTSVITVVSGLVKFDKFESVMILVQYFSS